HAAGDEDDHDHRQRPLHPDAPRDELHAREDQGERERVDAEAYARERVEEVAEQERAERAAHVAMEHAEVDGQHEHQVRRHRQGGDRGEDVGLEHHGDDRSRRQRGEAPHRQAGGRSSTSGGSAGATGPRVTSTSSRSRCEKRGFTSAAWKRPWPRRSIVAISPIGRPFGKMPSRPEVTSVSPTWRSSVRFTYFSWQPPSGVPCTMPRTRLRCTTASTPLLWSVTSST